MKKLLSSNIFIFGVIVIISAVISFFGIQALSPKPAIATSDCNGICVSLTKSGMNPDALFVKVGDYVQFNSADGKKHNISIGNGSNDHGGGHEAHESAHDHVGDYSSGDFGADEAWRVQFKKPGTYNLHDHYNPKLFITVVVYEPGADTTIR
jgi:plastocyanin